MSNKQIERVLNEFDFKKVKQAIDFFERQGDFGSPSSDVTVEDLKDIAKELLEDVYKVRDARPSYTIEFGGFEATRVIIPDTRYKKLSLSYVLTSTFDVVDRDNPYKRSKSPFSREIKENTDEDWHQELLNEQ